MTDETTSAQPNTDGATETSETLLTPSAEATTPTGKTEPLLGSEKETKSGDDDKTGDGEAKDTKDGEESKSEVPESYAFEMPEGMVLDEATAGKASEILKDMGASQQQADKLKDLLIDRDTRAAEESQKAFDKQVSDWTNMVRSDKDIGGVDFEKNIGIAKEAVDKFGDSELKEMLRETGVGNHPALVKAFYKIGTLLKEDSFNGDGATKELDPLQQLYGATTPGAR